MPELLPGLTVVPTAPGLVEEPMNPEAPTTISLALLMANGHEAKDRFIAVKGHAKFIAYYREKICGPIFGEAYNIYENLFMD